MSPRSVAPDSSAHRSDAKTFPSTVPRMVTLPALISPRIRPCSPTVRMPLDVMLPSTSPSITSSVRNVTLPLIDTPFDNKFPVLAGAGWVPGCAVLAGGGAGDGGGAGGAGFGFDPNIKD